MKYLASFSYTRGVLLHLTAAVLLMANGTLGRGAAMSSADSAYVNSALKPVPSLESTQSSSNNTLQPNQKMVSRGHFSARPTDAEIFGAHIFPQPLIPVGKSTVGENRALANVLASYVKRSDADDQSILTQFLRDHPKSVWKPALLINIGIAQRQMGYFSKAMEAWLEAWNLSKARTDIGSRALADRALGEYVQINAWVGRYEVLRPILEETKDRQLISGATELVSEARQGEYLMNHHPDSGFMCGPLALRQIANVTHAQVDLTKLAGAKSTLQGVSLARVKQLADEIGLKYQIAKREPGADIPLNSVIHWKLNHFGAITQFKDGHYLVQDSTFGSLYGYELWVSKAALDEEASGYFLIPTGLLPSGWSAVSDEEAQNVWGKGTTMGPDLNAFGPKEKKPCPLNGDPETVNGVDDGTGQYANYAMARASMHLMLISLNIVDTPIWYQPARGPKMNFTLTYNQRDPYSQAIPDYSNLGSKWTFDWFTYVADSTFSGGRNTVSVYGSGGGLTVYSSFNATTGYYAPDRDGNVLQYIGADDDYQLTFPSGGSEVFGYANMPTGSRRLYLTKIIDEAGNTSQLYYNDKGTINYVNDALGNATHLYYDLASDPYKITRVVIPSGKTAYFTYDLNGRLYKITDTIGITSAFSYGPGDFINQMSTPYGATTFAYSETGGTRTLLITDPDGGQQYAIYQDVTSIPISEAEVPDGAFDNYNLIYRNTAYFDKRVMNLFGTNDVSKATIYHFLHDNDNGSPILTSGILESIKMPLESRIWFRYPGQGDSQVSLGITLRKPCLIARVVDNQSNPSLFLTQSDQFTYNTQGRITSHIDPLGRVTTNDYYANGIDLMDTRQMTGETTSETLLSFGEYNSAHRPSTFVDSSLQTYNFTWNSYGQLTQVTNPKSEVTHYNYDATTDFLTSIVRDWSGGTKTTGFTYDAYGRLYTTTDSEGYSLQYGYDLLDRLTRVTYPDATFDEYDYSRLDLVRVADRMGQSKHMTYDSLGRMLTTQDRLGHTTQFSWCGCGSLESMTDALGHVTSWSEDLESRLLQKTLDDTKTTQLVYENRSSRLHSITDAKNQVKYYTNNLDNTIAGMSYSCPVGSTPPVSFLYDSHYRRITTMIDQTGETDYAYYPAGTTGILGGGKLFKIAGPNGTLGYAYDELGRTASQNINGSYSGTVITGGINQAITFDDLGRVSSHTTPMGVFDISYLDATLRPTLISYPNSQYISLGYTNNLHDQRLTSIWNGNTGDTGIDYNYSSFTHDYDVLGRMTNWTQHHEDGATYYKSLSLEYDAEGQLLDANIGIDSHDSDVAGYTDYSYGYDAVGNRTNQQTESNVESDDPGIPTVASKLSYNDVNQLTTRSGSGPLPIRVKGVVDEPSTVTVNSVNAVVTPDPTSTTGGQIFETTLSLATGTQTLAVVAKDFGASGGNITSQNYHVNVVGDKSKTYTYDDNGNCIGYSADSGSVSYTWDAEDRLTSVTSGTSVSTFVYDGLGRCVNIIEVSGGTTTSTKTFLWSGSKLCLENNLGGDEKAFFTEGMYDATANASYFYTFDHLGSIREMTDESGVIRARYDYDPYGKRTKVDGDLDADFGFTGHYVHAPTGLYITRYRAYDSEAGRWLSRDPIAEWGGLNMYDYVMNSPICFLDPLGLQEDLANPQNAEILQSLEEIGGGADAPINPLSKAEAQAARNALGNGLEGSQKISQDVLKNIGKDTLEKMKRIAQNGLKKAVNAAKNAKCDTAKQAAERATQTQLNRLNAVTKALSSM